jgi:hypothetical protein
MIAAAKSWFFGLPREARGLVVTACSIAFALSLMFVYYSWSAAYESWKEIDRAAPRIARLKGYELARDQIDVAASAVELALQELAFSDDSDGTQVGAQLQQILRGYAEESGLTVTGSQLLSSRDGDAAPEGFTVMRVQLNMSGLPSALSTFLSEVYRHSPMLDVTKLYVGQDRRRNSRSAKEKTSDELQMLRLDVHVSALLVTQ